MRLYYNERFWGNAGGSYRLPEVVMGGTYGTSEGTPKGYSPMDQRVGDGVVHTRTDPKQEAHEERRCVFQAQAM